MTAVFRNDSIIAAVYFFSSQVFENQLFYEKKVPHFNRWFFSGPPEKNIIICMVFYNTTNPILFSSLKWKKCIIKCKLLVNMGMTKLCPIVLCI